MSRELDVKVSLRSVEYKGESIGRDLEFALVVGNQGITFGSQGEGPGSIIQNTSENTISTRLMRNRNGRYCMDVQVAVNEKDEKTENCDHGTVDATIDIFQRLDRIPTCSKFAHPVSVSATDKQMSSKPTATFIFNIVTETFGRAK